MEETKKFIIPSEFTIATHTIKINQVEYVNNGDYYGEFVDWLDEIRIADKVIYNNIVYEVSERTKIHTFYHELIHAFNYYYNCETSEELAQVFSNFIMEYLNTVKY